MKWMLPLFLGLISFNMIDAQDDTPTSKLEKLAAKMATEIRSEGRLNLNMLAQLRNYQGMISRIENYAKDVEQNIDIIKEISKDSFQEDIKLQAALFSGKKPDTVTKHLEEFRSSRVGAILAKMKTKEASKILDVWATSTDKRINAFYREVMESYLNNKKYDMAPDLFSKVGAANKTASQAAKQ